MLAVKMFVCFLTNTTLFHPKINRSYVSGRGFCVPVIPGAILSRALALVGSPKANWPWVGRQMKSDSEYPVKRNYCGYWGPTLEPREVAQERASSGQALGAKTFSAWTYCGLWTSCCPKWRNSNILESYSKWGKREIKRLTVALHQFVVVKRELSVKLKLSI